MAKSPKQPSKRQAAKDAAATEDKKTTKPVRFTPELGERVCARIAEGYPVAKIGKLSGFPAEGTIFRWLATQDPDPKPGEEGQVRPFDAFREQYMRAREIRADARFERIDTVLIDMRAGKIDAQQARVEIDAIKWQAGKEKAKVYGEAVTLRGDKDNPLQIRKAPELSDEELAALAAGGLREAV